MIHEEEKPAVGIQVSKKDPNDVGRMKIVAE
jgi:hypothetical protein